MTKDGQGRRVIETSRKTMKTALIFTPLIILTVGCMIPSRASHLGWSPPSNDSIQHANMSYLGSQVITKTPENDAIVASQDGLIGPHYGATTRHYILGIGFGGGTLADAAMHGGIRQVTTVERHRQAILWPFYWNTKTVVTGDGPMVQVRPGAWTPTRSTRFYHHLSPTTPPTPDTTPAPPLPNN